ncbi:MAG: hypothetical protein ABIQ44_03830 [Chloroflexia bacterium]
MSDRETFLGAAIKGGIAGIAGTFAMSAGMEQLPHLLKMVDMEPPKRGEATGVGGGKYSERPVEKLADRIADEVFDKRLSKDARKAGGQLLHWAYGIGWGAFYGVVQSRLRLPHLVHGTLLAALMGVTAVSVVPATKVVPWPKDLPPQRTVLQMTYILMFAWTAALTFGMLSRRKKD